MRAAGRAATQMVANPESNTAAYTHKKQQLRAACMEYEANQGDYNFMGFPTWHCLWFLSTCTYEVLDRNPTP